MPALTLTLFGPPQLAREDEPVHLRSRKCLALLAYLVITGRAHRRDSLASLLWPESDAQRAQHSLRSTLFLLRRALDGKWLLVNREIIGLDGGQEEAVDVVRFRALLLQCLSHGHSLGETCPDCLSLLSEAVELYQGDFMAGFTLSDSPEFDEWQAMEGEALRRELAGALERLVEGCAAQGEVERATAHARRWVEMDPLDEAAHRALMQLYAGSGQQTAALRQFEACQRVLMDELGVVPSEETKELYTAIKERRVGQPYHRPPLVVAQRQVQCPNCSAENSEGARYCMKCGARLDLVCPECRTELPPDPEAKFCPSCGAEVVAPPAVHTSDSIPDRLGRVMPREFSERLMSTRDQVTRERRVVTMLFSDVKGSRSMTEDLDPEEVMEIIEGALDVLIEPITRYEGTLARMMGDAVLAFFGAPIAHEDDAERACRAALEIIEGASAYAVRLEQERDLSGFNVRVAIHTGLVVVGEVGPDLRVEYAAMGDAVSVTSGIQEAAEPGTVLITEDTQRLIAPLFETEDLGPIQIRGRAETMLVYRVLASKAVVGKPRGIEGLESPLVGRDTEFQALREVLQRLQAGVGGIVTIVGEAGIGKSRLVAELRKDAVAAPLRWVEGRCLSSGGSIVYLLWLDMLRSTLGMSIEDSPVALRDELQRLVKALCPDQVDEVYPYLGQLMSLPLEPQDEESIRDVEGEKLKAGTFNAVQTLIERAASERPLVLVCEDLHWADPSSIELLEQLLALTDRASLLFLCVFRPDREHGSWRLRETAARRHPHRHTGLWLDALSADESETLVSNLLGVEGLPEKVRSRILSQSEGNPFYVEEVIRSLIDRGAIVQDEASSRWQATADVSSISIPDTLHGVLMARIDRLHEEARRVLRLASVIGRTFLYRILAAISEEERELDEQLIALQREEMIRERARLPELEYIFKHELTREAAYEGLLKQQRRGFHLRVGEALERLFPERVEEQLGVLAHHFTQAEAWEKAFHYLTRSGHRARRAYANHEAIAFYTHAIEVSSRITPPVDEAQLLPVHEGRGLVFRLMTRPDEAIADFHMMRQMARASGNQQKEGESLINLAGAHYAKLSPEEIPFVEQYAQEAVRLAQLTGDQRTVAGSLNSLHLVHEARGELKAGERKLEESLQISRREGYKDMISDNLRNLSEIAYHQGDYERAVALCQKALAVAREINDGGREFYCLPLLCLIHASLGNCGEALETIHEGMTKAREQDNKWFVGRLTNTLGWVHGLFGDFSRAAEHDQESAELARTIGAATVEISALINLGADYVGLRQYERARSHLEALPELIETGSYGSHTFLWKPRLLIVLAEACHAMGDHQEALRYVEESLGAAMATSIQKYVAKGWALRGRVLAHLGEAEAAGADLQRAFALAEKLNSPSISYPIAFELGRWYEEAGQDREAAELYGRAKAEVERMAAAMEDEGLRTVFLQSASVQDIYESFTRVG